MIKDLFEKYRPPASYPPYPTYHRGLYLEDYFYNYYYSNNIQTNRIFIPVSWTTLYVENKKAGLQETLDGLDPSKSYFTVSQHDNAVLEKLPEDTKKFSAGGNSGGIPIPLACSPIPKEDIPVVEKDLLCSFYGSTTHRVRQYMVSLLKDKPDVVAEVFRWSIKISKERYENYLRTAARSKFLLCPRGYGPHSFRQYEAFQLGCVPVIISDIRFLPWEDELDWNSFAIVTDKVDSLYEMLKSIPEDVYNSMLTKGKELYENYFTLEATCRHIVKRLKKEEYE